MLSVRLNGIDYTTAIDAQATTSIRSICGSFAITSSAKADGTLPIRKGDFIQVLADGLPIVTGYVDSIDGRASANDHTITITGRDATQDLVDSSVGVRKQFKGGITLTSLIESVLSDIGLSSIKVTDGVGGLAPFKSSELASAEVGQSGFEFIEAYCRKRQVLPIADGLGGILLIRGAPTSSGIKLVHLINDRKGINNVLESSFVDDDSKRYNEYQICSSSSPLFSLTGGYNPGKATNIVNKATDSKVRKGRRLEFQSEKALDDAESKNRCSWEANLRRAESLQYRPTIQGHSIDRKRWKPNQTVQVIDEYWDLNAELLISDVQYSYSVEGGSITSLILTYPDAYTLEANLDALKSNKNKIAAKFSLT